MKTPVNDSLCQEIRQDADRILKEGQVAPIHLAGYQAYLRNGNRLTFERQYFERRRQLTTLALALCLTEEERQAAILNLLEEVIWQICNEYTWGLPAHLPILMEAKVFSEESPRIIDLFAAETAQSLAEILEIHGELLSKQVRMRIETEVEQRVFLPFEEREWEWEHLENNWSAVIAGSIGMAALSLLPVGSERQQAIIQRLEKAFSCYLHSFQEDGACVEGVGYWSYGFGYYCYFAEKYKQTFQDGRFLQEDKLKTIAAFPYYTTIGKKRYIPFSDASDSEVPSGLLTFCHRSFGVPIPEITQATDLHYDHCYRWAPAYRNLIWTEHHEENDTGFVHYFEDSQWLVIKEPAMDLIFAAKGGKNNESHNHNDAGHFVIGSEKELLLTDLGAGEYTQDYFNDETRYQFLQNRSLGHSVPLIQGQEQRYGDYAAAAVWTETAEKVTFSLELPDVYPPLADLKHFTRTWEWPCGRREINLTDQMEFASGNKKGVIQSFVSEYQPVRSGNRIDWQGREDKLILEFDPELDDFFVREEMIRTHKGEEAVVYRAELHALKEGGDYHRNYLFRLEKNR